MDSKLSLTTRGAVLFLGLTISHGLSAADFNGTPNNDILYLQGTTETVNQVITNPFSGESITLNSDYYVNNASYDGLGGIDSLLMTNLGDLLFLEDPTGVQWLWNVERLLAGSGGDVLHLASTTVLLGDMVIIGGASADIIWSNVGNDTIDGQHGSDQIHGGPGNDSIYGGDGDDSVEGGMGDDTIYGEDGILIANGGPGKDVIYADPGGGDDVVIGESGNDKIYVWNGADIADGGPGDDFFFDNVDLKTDFFSGGAGEDTVNIGGNAQFTIVASSDPNYQLDLVNQYDGFVEARVRDIEFAQIHNSNVDLTAFLVTQLNCNGFLAPFTQNLTLRNKSKKTIPVKMTLTDKDGMAIGAQHIQAPPVLNVTFSGTVFGSTPEDNEDLLSNGSANEGNTFSYDVNTQEWIYLLGTKQFSQAGVYEVTVKSGDNSEYVIDADSACEQTFTRLQ